MTEPSRSTYPPPPTVTYWALSAAKSKTYRANGVILLAALVPLLALPEVVALMSPRVLLLSVAATAVANLVLRKLTVRPIAFIAPGQVKAVEVPKIEAPATVTD